MKTKIMECFERLQTMTIQATKENLEAMLKTIYDLQDVYKEMEEDDGRDAADIERRVDH